MIKLKSWVAAARLRTLPLSVSGILVGSVLGHSTIGGTLPFYQTPIFWFAILTTLGLQILSNFANDYGDGVKGTDNKDRVGPKRALQSGLISKKEMFFGIVLTAIFSLCAAIALIYIAFGKENFMYSCFFFILGIIAIVAAIKYTMGDTAYGYRGLGDLFVFLFFGLVSVLGCYFLYAKTLQLPPFFPAISIGLLSTAVLNLNNMRDHDNDKKSNKNTLVVKMGVPLAKKYHYTLIGVAMVSMITFSLFTYQSYIELLYCISFIPLVLHLRTVLQTDIAADLDPELKKVALSTFLLAVLFSIGYAL